MYQALYRKYRPQTFDDVVGQQAVTQTLKNQLQTGKLSHAYLFTGSRGTGKTSSAKILAKAVNCETPQDGNPCNCCASCRAIDSGSCMDVLEIDAASNNGVDNVRDLRDDAVYTPSQVKKRVYIIDEVHMLSISAFNALLKIIEEPPEHLLFILATTELHKVPATILSRCQRFAFRRIGQDDIAARLQYVAYQENIELEDGAARIIARLADGGMRDGLSLLDQCASATQGDLTAEKVYACLGIAGVQECGKLMQFIGNHDSAKALSLLNHFYSEGKDMGALLDELTCLCRDLMILKTAPAEGIGMLSGVASEQDCKMLMNVFSIGELVRMMGILQQTIAGFTRSSSRRMDAELCVVNLCQPELSLDTDALNARISRMEERLQNGTFVLPAQQDTNNIPAIADEPEEMETLEVQEPKPAPVDEAPLGFWSDVVTQVRNELKPPVLGFFTTNQDAPVRGVLQNGKLVLQCSNSFTYDMINKADVLDCCRRKASAILGASVDVVPIDQTSKAQQSKQMEQLLSFGRAHADRINIKE